MTRSPLLILAVASSLLLSCTPMAAVSCRHQTVGADPRVAKISLVNRFPKGIVRERVLIHSAIAENRLYLFSAELRPGETKRVVGSLANRNQYDFKNAGPCKVDYVQFADGTTWDAPSPM